MAWHGEYYFIPYLYQKNVLSKIYMSFDSPPNDYMDSLIHWSTETIAFLKMSSPNNSKNIHKHR